MRMTRKSLSRVTVHKPKQTKLADEDVYLWEPDGTTILANVQPISFTQGSQSQVIVEMFGERVKNMLVMYYAGVLPLHVGMGVRTAAMEENVCDYRIVGVFPWTAHQQAALELIPENQRGKTA